MSKLEDIPMPKSVANEVKDMFYGIRLLLNNGRYQSTVYTTAPTTSTTGQSGEMRLVVEGTSYNIYWSDGTTWYKSGAFSAVT